MNAFTRLDDMNSLGGTEEADANIVDECLMACSDDAACLAVDFDATQVEGLRCAQKHSISHWLLTGMKQTGNTFVPYYVKLCCQNMYTPSDRKIMIF